jgi:FKBP-type peptidyl-prolyl cis-trans isomerase
MKLHLFLVLLWAFQVSAQNSFRKDFEYKHPSFASLTLTFCDTAGYFHLLRGSKVFKIESPKIADTQFWLKIAADKKLKLTAQEIVLIQDAWPQWSKFRKTIGFTMQPSGLGIKMLSEGKGDYPPTGQNVKVHYTGTLEDGTKFDSSVDRGQPFEFPLGMGRVIKGWDEGIAKLRKGSRAILLIPAELGYGERGAGGVIPPNATLFFEVEVLE